MMSKEELEEENRVVVLFLVRTYMQLVQIRRRWWEVRLLGLEGLPHLGHGSQDPVARVHEALLET